MKYVFLFSTLLIYSLSVISQDMRKLPHERKINFGIKGGFNSSMYFVDRFKIKDVTIDEIQNNYKVGYWGAFFMHINMKKHFLQPEFIYNISKSEIEFDKKGSQHPDVEPDYASIISTIRTGEFALLYGYNFIKTGPYGMNFFIGPKIKYIWNEKSTLEFSDFDQKGINEELYPINLSAVAGIGVSISNIFFDFRYEAGLHNISRKIIYDNIGDSGREEPSQVIFHRRCNILSFSLGFIF